MTPPLVEATSAEEVESLTKTTGVVVSWVQGTHLIHFLVCFHQCFFWLLNQCKWVSEFCNCTLPCARFSLSPLPSSLCLFLFICTVLRNWQYFALYFVYSCTDNSVSQLSPDDFCRIPSWTNADVIWHCFVVHLDPTAQLYKEIGVYVCISKKARSSGWSFLWPLSLEKGRRIFKWTNHYHILDCYVLCFGP